MVIDRDHVFAALRKYFGFERFRPLQQEIVESILSGSDCLAILPTGGGKSLCFQLPGMLFSGVTLVISPLISLMTDQVHGLLRKNISAVALTSLLEGEESQRVLREIKMEKYRFVYVSPEKLLTTAFLNCIDGVPISQVVIDEAHCISEWGHQFRPQYLNIVRCVERIQPRPVVAAFTASATPRTQRDICTQLDLNAPRFFMQSVFRQNLSLHVIPCETGTVQQLVLHRLLKRHHDTPMIIYCATRRKTEEVSAMLRAKGLLAAAYHAGLEKRLRQSIQQEYLENKLHVICATTAFGMGVDKPDIRAVIHLNIPNSLEGYYQEIGRAGRDGLQSWCYLLAQPSDISLQQEIIDRSYPPTNCCTLLLQHFKDQHKALFPFRELLHSLLPVQEDGHLWLTLKRGEDQGWWTVQWQQRWIKLVLPVADIWQRWQNLSHQHAIQLSKLNAMRDYIERLSCRQQQLVQYFEHASAASACKACDRCTGEALGKPTSAEKQYYRKVERTLKKSHAEPIFLQQLCLEILATVQPASAQEVAWLTLFGNGWHHKMAKRLWPPDTNRHPQIRAVDSTHGYRSQRSPPAS